MTLLLVFSTVPADHDARALARTLVQERLAACVQILPALTSVYVWQDQLEASAETLLLLKTHRDLYPALEARLRALHPYEVPEIVAVELTAALPAYAQWLAAQTQSSPATPLLPDPSRASRPDDTQNG